MREKLRDNEILHQICAVGEHSVYSIQTSRPDRKRTEQGNAWHSMSDKAREPTESHERRAGGRNW